MPTFPTPEAVVQRQLDAYNAHDIEALLAILAEFESAYALPSTEFYQRYQNGLTDDRMDFVEWASLVQMANNLQMELID